jgi:peptidoglycan lytic transglycosylase
MAYSAAILIAFDFRREHLIVECVLSGKVMRAGRMMCRWRPTAAALTIAAVVCSISNKGVAQTFEERWSPIPKAHADQNPPPPTESRSSNGVHNAPAPQQSGAAANRTPARKAVFVGMASYYSYRGGKTASGTPYDARRLTAAHRTLPFGTRVRVTDIKTHKSVEVTITDRGPVSRSRVIDLSLGAAKALGIGHRGIIQVRAQVISG